MDTLATQSAQIDYLANTQTYIMVLLGLSVVAITIVLLLWRRLISDNILKYEFITIMAHKFRTPLTQIKWLAESLLADEQNSFKRESLMNLKMSDQKLIDLTGVLIELTDADNKSKSSYNFEKVSLNDLVRKLYESMKEAFHQKNIYFGFKGPDQHIYANVDTQRMESVLQTLLENAYTYTPPGRDVEIVIGEEGKKAIIQISDHGIGIDRNDLPKMFSKFYRTENAQRTDTEGFGIGLFLARAIIRRHGGRLDVYSPGLDQGSTFTITLPAVK